ncbi:MAG: YihY/virulence factor BrkB family protein [Caldimonas sp.]
MDIKAIATMARQAASAWVDDYAPSMGAALAYYTLFSIAPLILIVISIAGLAFGDEAARGQVFVELRGFMGEEGASAVQALLKSVNEPKAGIIAVTVGVGVLLVGATTVFGELQSALDRIWRAPQRGGSGVWALVRSRLLSLGMVLGIGFLLIVSLLASTAVSALGKWWAPVFGGWEVLAQGVDFVLGFVLVTLVFAMIYKLMPRVRIRWHDVWIGAAVTSLLFAIGKFLIGLYIGKSSFASGFGAAGSLVVMLVWMYYSAQIFLFGAEFTWIYAHTYGSRRSEPRPGLPTDPSAKVAAERLDAIEVTRAALRDALGGKRPARGR